MANERQTLNRQLAQMLKGGVIMDVTYLDAMDFRVRRNAYGRQLGSFNAVAPVEAVGSDIPMTFIRAPYIEEVLIINAGYSLSLMGMLSRPSKDIGWQRPFIQN